jgi:P27 family predicted phage terminase small subunit
MSHGGPRPNSGRKRVPTALRIITGNTRKDRMPANEPQFKSGRRPKPPAHLDKVASEEWAEVIEDLYTCGVVTAMDRTTLAMYCQAYSAWTSASLAWNAHVRDCARRKVPATYVRSTGRRAPALVAMQDTALRLVRLAAELGMTPASRGRVHAAKVAAEQGGEEDRGAKFFDGPGAEESAA